MRKKHQCQRAAVPQTSNARNAPLAPIMQKCLAETSQASICNRIDQRACAPVQNDAIDDHCTNAEMRLELAMLSRPNALQFAKFGLLAQGTNDDAEAFVPAIGSARMCCRRCSEGRHRWTDASASDKNVLAAHGDHPAADLLPQTLGEVGWYVGRSVTCQGTESVGQSTCGSTVTTCFVSYR